jgi:hypothetical protein
LCLATDDDKGHLTLVFLGVRIGGEETYSDGDN